MKEQLAASRRAGQGGKSTRKVLRRKSPTQRKRGADAGSKASSVKKAKPTGPGNGNNALAKKIVEIKELLIEADRRDVAARYKVAVECQEVIDGDGKGRIYGAGAAQQLAVALGWSRSAIYAHAAVAKTWKQKQFDELLEERDKFGKPLSWSHLMVLATEKNPHQRRTLTKQTLKRGSSVRDLKQAVQGKLPNAKAAGIEESKSPRPLVNAVDNYASNLEAAKSNAEVYGEEIVGLVENAPPAELRPKLLERLKQVRADLEAQYRAEAKRLDALIEKIETGKYSVLESGVDVKPDARPSQRSRK